MARKVLAHIRAQWMGALALFLVIAEVAYAANTIGSSDVINESLLSQDIQNNQIPAGSRGPQGIQAPSTSGRRRPDRAADESSSPRRSAAPRRANADWGRYQRVSLKVVTSTSGGSRPACG